MIVPVVLSGGSGSRLWPLSRALCPKQLLPLFNERTMLQDTITRLEGVSDLGLPLVVCNDEHRFMVAEQLRQIRCAEAEIFLEPVGRNTAPAVAVAALQVLDCDDDPVLLVLPADHVISNTAALAEVIEKGRGLAERGMMVTFGVVPSGPETGYGYIKAGRQITPEESSATAACAVECFVEKPGKATAEDYLRQGGYYWNSGMFMFRASRYIKELGKFSPEMVDACRSAIENGVRDLDFVRLDSNAFSSCPSDSIDYAVMEKTESAAVIPFDGGWSDVGSWSAMWEIGEQDAGGNVTRGDVVMEDTRNCYVHGTARLIATVGLEDHVVVETADAVLVSHKDRVQDVKAIVDQLKSSQRDEVLLHRKVNRPWGTYECIDQAERFKVKRITVDPGETLSSQMHYHRAEHWVVVEGTARITIGDSSVTLSENQSTFIPLGVTHRLENPGKIPLEMIEVQSGSYLGEDDIVRFEDQYGR